MSNPLSAIRFSIPFDRIEPAHVEPAIGALIDESKARLEAIAACAEPRTYANTLGAYDDMTEGLDWAFNIVRHLESVATTPELRAAYNAVQEPVSAFYSSIVLHEGLWKALKAYAATADAAALTGARKRFLDKTLDYFRRAGADLPPEGKTKLEAIDVELAQVTTKFSENVLDSTNAWDLVLTSEAQIAGLPPSAVEAARESAKSKNVEGWRFTLQQPSYQAVMTYLDDAAIRESVYRAFNARAASGEKDNRELTLRILALRREKARLLGFRDFADLILADRMAHDGATAQSFIDDLRTKTIDAWARENAELEAFAGRKLNPWDVGYYAEKQRKALYDFDEEVLRPYFPLDRVLAGMFDIFGRVFGIRVAERTGVPVWDPAVKCYDIHDAASGRHTGTFYADWFPRENKRGGAWMDSFLTGKPGPGGKLGPHVGLMCGNLTPPAGGKPALLAHRDVETIFHEFGHLLHHCLSEVEVRGLAGTSVPWDFVELPSQIMENWCWERESLDLFARHYETGETIPPDLFDKLKRARTFRAANGQMRQLGFAFVDLGLHRNDVPASPQALLDYARETIQQFSAAKLPESHAMILAFTHLFSSPVAYGAGYYSYKWAEVLDADAFTRFRAEGIFSERAGRDFRFKILARGDSEDPAQLFRDYMGRDPDPRALLERSGLAA